MVNIALLSGRKRRADEALVFLVNIKVFSIIPVEIGRQSDLAHSLT